MAKKNKKPLPKWAIGVTLGIALISALVTRLSKRR